MTGRTAPLAAAASAALPPFSPARAWLAWEFAPLVSAALLLAAAAYLAGTWRVAARRPASQRGAGRNPGRRRPAGRWPAWRTLAFLAGLAVIAVATQGSPGVYDDTLFSAHMVQHLLLIMVAPPLLVLGRPVTLLLHAAPPPLHRRVRRAVRTGLVTAVSRPAVATAAYCAVVTATHLPPVMDLVLRNPVAHDAEHLLYLASGYLFFLAVVGSEPVRWRVGLLGRYLMLLIVMPVDTLVGVVLMTAPREIYLGYAAGGAAGPGLVSDLHTGGLIMWLGSDLVMTLLAVGLATAFIHDPRLAGSPGRWVEGTRRAALRRGIAATGGTQPPGRSVDDDAHLAAYNAYLSALSGPSAGAPGRR